ncbi:cell division protein ZapA [Martelella mediterranea]|uniref:Cell division protein ZapA n=1 Tax=Martelella mediterranea TaxID=293089 RepID=A0A4R3NV25_9HYPH|nr:cell division protein ZapA [Martelella mediterranea]TCT42852.1 cell division protein ZapA [Martelella mediterranea]
MAQVTVNIDGKAYRMACEAGQEDHLQALAARFDGYIANLRGQFGEIGDLRLTVMAGIMVMDELSDLQAQIDSDAAELQQLRTAAENADNTRLDRENEIAGVLEDLAGRLSDLSQKVSASKG